MCPSAVGRIMAVIQYIFISLMLYGSLWLGYTRGYNFNTYIIFISMFLWCAVYCALKYKAHMEKFLLKVLIIYWFVMMLSIILLFGQMSVIYTVCIIFLKISVQLFFIHRYMMISWLIKQTEILEKNGGGYDDT